MEQPMNRLDHQLPQRRAEIHYDDRRVLCFTPRPAGLHALLADAVKRNADGEALVAGTRRLRYTDLDLEVGLLAEGLKAQGIRQGHRVAVLLGNCIEFVVLVFAIARLGAIWVPLNTRDQEPGIRHMLTDSGARLLIAHKDLADRVPRLETVPDLRNRFLIGGHIEGFEPYEALRAASPLKQAVPTHDDDTVAIFYTSGTTGLAKGAMLTNLGLVHSAMHYQLAMELTEQDRSVLSVPLGHVTGMIAIVLPMILAGGTVVMMDEFKPVAFLKLAEAERMTHTVLVPAQYNLMLLQPDHNQYDLRTWRIGGFGGAPMPTVTIERLNAWLPNLSLMNLYGATETSSPTTMMPPSETARRADSVGLVVPCGHLRVVDDDGRDVPVGASGEIWMAGPMVVPGYWQNPEATAREFTDGYWHSGDIGSIDGEGFVRVFDRKKDMINRGGLKVFTTEVENVLTAYEDIAEAAVVGKPCPVLGERVHAFVVPREGSKPDIQEIMTFCRRQLADYKVPESISIRLDPLPRNTNGKVLKRNLRDLPIV